MNRSTAACEASSTSAAAAHAGSRRRAIAYTQPKAPNTSPAASDTTAVAPPRRHVANSPRSKSHCRFTHGAPAAVKENGSTAAISPICAMRRPLARCHHVSGSSSV
ncbi:MAG: hypothetical protein U0807_05045 [Candidatus Binatia bacterium]